MRFPENKKEKKKRVFNKVYGYFSFLQFVHKVRMNTSIKKASLCTNVTFIEKKTTKTDELVIKVTKKGETRLALTDSTADEKFEDVVTSITLRRFTCIPFTLFFYV